MLIAANDNNNSNMYRSIASPATNTRHSVSGKLLSVFLLFFLSTHECLGFVTPSVPAPTTAKYRSNRSRSTRVAAMDHGLSSSPIVVDPSLEAESLTVMAHVALDFSGFVLSPSRSLIRLFAVMGRICSITADYLVDHSIHTEELMIQLFLISVALKDLFSEGSPSSNTTTNTK